MMKVYRTKAYGKINLYLRITGKREDGYHTLETVFQSVSLCDQVSIIVHRNGGISLRCNRPYIPRDERNIAYKAALAFFDAAGIENSGLYINIKKVIPVGAGMAGGSTDAAAVLQLLNRAYNEPLSEVELLRLGLTLGADVPFCMQGGAALATGIGEELSPLPPVPDCHIVICKPSVSVSTKAAYQLVDEAGEGITAPLGDITAAMERRDLRRIADSMANDFEAPIAAVHPEITQIRQALLQTGAIGAMMTGSGSAVFGLFGRMQPAAAAAAKLKKEYRDVYIARPMV